MRYVSCGSFGKHSHGSYGIELKATQFYLYVNDFTRYIDNYLKNTFVSYDVTNVIKSITSLILYPQLYVSYNKFNFQATIKTTFVLQTVK